jgi:Protein of unknown function (DUF1631)
MTLPALSSANDSDAAPPMGREEANALLRTGYARFEKKLMELAAAALDLTDDLFESTSTIPNGEVETFRQKRPEWLARFQTTLSDLFARRLGGHHRKGLRPDAEASLGALRVLTPFDHEKQASLTDTARFLTRFTQRELAALDLRVGMLLDEVAGRELDNPFAIPYVLDALGSTSRAIYPNPRVWRPLMERLLTDLTPNFNGLYIALNGMLADHGVLPEIKATLRARSEHRPSDDRDLLATFTQMMHDAEPAVPANVVVPDLVSDPNAPPALRFDRASRGAGGTGDAAAVSAEVLAGLAALAARGAAEPVAPPSWAAALTFHDRPLSPVAGSAGGSPQMASADILAGLAALATIGAQNVLGAGGNAANLGAAGPDAAAAGDGFPSLDPLMALGTSTSLFATLAQWQKLDLPAAIARYAPAPVDGASGPGAVVPLNLIPHIRAAIATQISNPADAISVDVIALLFDYIFRDPAIGPSTRALFGRLQVPIVKAALLDRTFFSDPRHPARQLLDHLADAAVGAAHDDAYRAAFEDIARKAIDHVCADFEIDVTVFRDADRQLVAFGDRERQKAADGLSQDVAEAMRAEEAEADRAVVRALLRDRLAGLDVPFEVRSFVETLWADYLALLHKEHGEDSPAWNAALTTLDDMLWSIVTKERTAQKARLTKMIPSLIGGLRTGCKALQVPAERSKSFFESLYQLHMAAIKPPAPATAEPTAEAKAGATSTANSAAGEVKKSEPRINVHDYVAEMAVGTWLQFDRSGGVIDARLNWVSPLRAKYIFTTRSRAGAFILTPEELAYQLGSGAARLVVEPVPLWDRAVSAALDALAARKPAAGAHAAAPAMA